MGNFDLLSFLTGVSPWWWIAFAVALAAIEIVTFTYFVLWLAIAALGAGVALAIFPDMTGSQQIIVFSALALAITVGGRYWLASRKEPESDAPGLNRRSKQLIGRVGKALDDFDGDEGVVVVDDVRWRARLRSGGARRDQRLSVVDADGMTLVCEPT